MPHCSQLAAKSVDEHPRSRAARCHVQIQPAAVQMPPRSSGLDTSCREPVCDPSHSRHQSRQMRRFHHAFREQIGTDRARYWLQSQYGTCFVRTYRNSG